MLLLCEAWCPQAILLIFFVFSGPLSNDTVFMFTYQQVGTKDILLNQSRIVIVPLANLILPAGAINATVIINATHPGSLFLGIATNSSEINLNT